MAHRIGVCGSCRARFQIPAQFGHRQARCRTCGGVVEIGPLLGELGPAPTPAASRAAPPDVVPAPPESRAHSAQPITAGPTTAGPITPAPTASETPLLSPSLARPQAPPRKRTGLIGAIVVVGIAVLLALGLRSWLGRRGGPRQAAGTSTSPDAGSESRDTPDRH